MAVGTVNSQAGAEQAVLRSGEKQAITAAALKDPKARVFRHMIPGAKFVMPDGLELIFMGGQFATTDPDQIRELEAVSNKSTSMIYTEANVAAHIKGQQQQLATDASDTAGKDKA